MEEQKGATEAEYILESLGFDQLPINPENVVNNISDTSYPVKITFRNFSSEQFLGRAIGNDEKAEIVVNTNIPEARRVNFTSAHEIGHVCMHIMPQQKLNFSCGINEINDSYKDPYERQANGFASALLMPRQLVKVLTDGDVNWNNIKQVSDACNTSLEATFRRMSWIEKAPVAMVIHQNNMFKRFIATDRFDFYIEKSNLSYEQIQLCVDVTMDQFPADYDSVDPLDWINPEKKGLKLTELYVSSIKLTNGFVYTILSYDDDCIEDIDD